MSYYDIKPYTVLCFDYCGSSRFIVEIFSCYAVEIDYGLNEIPFELGNLTTNHLGCDLLELLPPTECEIQKFCSTLDFNAKSTWSAAYEFFICESHVSNQKFCEVLPMETCTELGLNKSITWIELSFTQKKWHINLHWDSGHVYFTEEWYKFIEESRIEVGHLCVLRYTSSVQKFEVAIFDKLGMENFYQSGLDGKGLLKFVKIMNYETVLTGEMEIPRLFHCEFGWTLAHDVKLVLGDGYEYKAYFCEGSKLLIGLKAILNKYSVYEDYVLSFELVGRSTFYVNIYSEEGMDIFNNIFEKMMLPTLIKKLEDDVVVLTYSSMDVETENSEGLPVLEVESGILEDSSGCHLGRAYAFTRILTGSNVNKNGNGVYLGLQLFPLYKSWKKSQIVTIAFVGGWWTVGVYLFNNQCRLGRGWNEFVAANNLQVGDKLKFTHVAGSMFEVCYDN